MPIAFFVYTLSMLISLRPEEKQRKWRPKRQEEEKRAREAKMWFGYSRRYTGGTWDGMKKDTNNRKKDTNNR